MQTLDATDTPVIEKTKELCQLLLEQESYKKLKADIDQFMADEEAKGLYNQINLLRDQLVHKQRSGQAIGDAEMDEFEKGREAVLANPVCLGFIEAQQGLQTLQDSVNQFLSMTIDSGKVPTTEEVEAQNSQGGCCGGGCGGGGGCS